MLTALNKLYIESSFEVAHESESSGSSIETFLQRQVVRESELLEMILQSSQFIKDKSFLPTGYLLKYIDEYVHYKSTTTIIHVLVIYWP